MSRAGGPRPHAQPRHARAGKRCSTTIAPTGERAYALVRRGCRLCLARGRCTADVYRRQSGRLRAAALAPQIIWSKQHFTLGRGDYHWKHENLLVRGCATARPATGKATRTQTTVWEIANNNPFGKPAARAKLGTRGHRNPWSACAVRSPTTAGRAQAVYDPFLGSGTSVIAAEMTGRVVLLGIELSPHYVRCRGATMAALHRPCRKTSSLRSVLRRAPGRAGPRLIRSCTWREPFLSSMMGCARRCGNLAGLSVSRRTISPKSSALRREDAAPALP